MPVKKRLWLFYNRSVNKLQDFSTICIFLRKNNGNMWNIVPTVFCHIFSDLMLFPAFYRIGEKKANVTVQASLGRIRLVSKSLHSVSGSLRLTLQLAYPFGQRSWISTIKANNFFFLNLNFPLLLIECFYDLADVHCKRTLTHRVPEWESKIISPEVQVRFFVWECEWHTIRYIRFFALSFWDFQALSKVAFRVSRLVWIAFPVR